MRVFIVAEESILDVVYNEVYSKIGSASLVGRLNNGRVEQPAPFLPRSKESRPEQRLQPVAPGDVVLVFGDAVAPDVDAASRIWVVDGLKFLRACSQTNNDVRNYLYEICLSGPTEEAYQSYARPSTRPQDIQPNARLIVNSFPKSGSIWMMAMIGNALGLSTDKHVHLAHGAEMELALCTNNILGSVALVRDPRDVVVSWFHEAVQCDVSHGFSEPRYRNVSEFYYQYFVGRIFGNPQYYYGNLDRWLDYLSARAIPTVKYEDLLENADEELQRIMNFWKIDIDQTNIATAVSRMSFATIKENVGDGSSYIAERLGNGHARQGQSGGWRDALPAEVARDIETRLAGYMHRLGYQSFGHQSMMPKIVTGE